MILVAESGASTTDWVLIGEGGERCLAREGLNPYHVTIDFIYKEILAVKNALGAVSVGKVFFYGAGCFAPSQQNILKECFEKVYPSAAIFIYDDLMATAKGLLNNQQGVVAILGTGSIAGIYNGKEIIQRRGGHGIMLGDEGSAADIGKQLLRSMLDKEMSEDIIISFEKEKGKKILDIRSDIYSNVDAKRYLAKFSLFVYENKTHPSIRKVIANSFKSFVEINVKPLLRNQHLPIVISGSVAWFFREEIKDLLNSEGIVLKEISQKPIKQLTEYYRSFKRRK